MTIIKCSKQIDEYERNRFKYLKKLERNIIDVNETSHNIENQRKVLFLWIEFSSELFNTVIEIKKIADKNLYDKVYYFSLELFDYLSSYRNWIIERHNNLDLNDVNSFKKTNGMLFRFAHDGFQLLTTLNELNERDEWPNLWHRPITPQRLHKRAKHLRDLIKVDEGARLGIVVPQFPDIKLCVSIDDNKDKIIESVNVEFKEHEYRIMKLYIEDLLIKSKHDSDLFFSILEKYVTVCYGDNVHSCEIITEYK